MIGYNILFDVFRKYLTADPWRNDSRQVTMDQPFLMLRTRLTSDVIAGIKVGGMDDSINTVTDEWNTYNVSEIRQGGSTYHMDHNKVERYSPNRGEIDENNTCDNIDINEEGVSQDMENIRESFTSDSIDIKEETDDYILDIKEEGISENMENIRQSFTSDSIDIKEETDDYILDIKEEGISENMENIRQSFTSDSIDIKEETDDCILDIKAEGISQNIENITNSFTSDGIDIKEETDDYIQDVKEEGISQSMDDGENDVCYKARINVSENMDTISESYSCVDFETKEQDTDLDIDDIKKEGIYHLSGNVSVTLFYANMVRRSISTTQWNYKYMYFVSEHLFGH